MKILHTALEYNYGEKRRKLGKRSKKIMIVKLKGGLGNQMFQYAMARAVAYRSNLPLKLDMEYFENGGLHQYRLGHFNIIEDFATEDDIKQFKPSRKQTIAFAIYKIKEKFSPWYDWRKKTVIKERSFLFNPDILKIRGSVYLDGYWQSEKYFADISHIIRCEFTIKYEPNSANRQILKKIDDTNSVSLHVRRGDYATNPKTLQMHGVLSLDYYMNALDLISEKIKEPHIFIFSDDIFWVKKNLKSALPLYFVEHNGKGQDYEDLRLMSRCKHHIIANSSFSWWGAWLSENPHKIVIAPNQWFSEERMKKMGENDIIPKNWIKI